jgi:hypothetical protein
MSIIRPSSKVTTKIKIQIYTNFTDSDFFEISGTVFATEIIFAFVLTDWLVVILCNHGKNGTLHFPVNLHRNKKRQHRFKIIYRMNEYILVDWRPSRGKLINIKILYLKFNI